MSLSNTAFAEGGQPAPFPENEPIRLAHVHECGILDTPEEESFNRLTRLIAMLQGVPIAGISLIDEHRQWIKSRFGPIDSEGPRRYSFCSYALLSGNLFVVPDTHGDPRFARNPQVVGPPGIRFYAGAPLISSSGYKLGAFFVVDIQPRGLSEIDRRVLRDFAAIAVDLIEARAKYHKEIKEEADTNFG